MKRLALIVASSLVIGLFACATQSIPDAQFGLVKGSAFDPPTPKAYMLDGSGAKGAAETAYLMPALSKHDNEEYLPITADKNQCLVCHDNPGAEKKAGSPTPIPSSHYATAAAGSKPAVAGARYKCDLCHSAAADVPDLVGNTGPKPKR
ncbi:MAG: nitrate reductase cytochrome c-type subunit [Burkholderiales bacterium]|jgi:nitrate reductase cytochrome c-type subunit|nr:nitrate reductase cytochrome c-type subunit [Burkholderiales bacterium]